MSAPTFPIAVVASDYGAAHADEVRMPTEAAVGSANVFQRGMVIVGDAVVHSGQVVPASMVRSPTAAATRSDRLASHNRVRLSNDAAPA